MKKKIETKRTLAITTDYHTHSHFSADGSNSPEAMCEAALNLGIDTLALTEHAEWFGFGLGFPNVERYMARVHECQQVYGPAGLQLLTGVELGNPHDFAPQAHALLDRYQFDVVIGSVHYLNGHNIHHPECFNDPNPARVFDNYFAEVGKLVDNFPVQILAHFDRILWRAYLLHIPFVIKQHEQAIKEAFTAILDNHVQLELNTKLLGREPNWHAELAQMLRWYREVGGETILVNSDGHSVEEFGQNHSIARRLLAETSLTIGRLLEPAHAL